MWCVSARLWPRYCDVAVRTALRYVIVHQSLHSRTIEANIVHVYVYSNLRRRSRCGSCTYETYRVRIIVEMEESEVLNHPECGSRERDLVQIKSSSFVSWHS